MLKEIAAQSPDSAEFDDWVTRAYSFLRNLYPADDLEDFKANIFLHSKDYLKGKHHQEEKRRQLREEAKQELHSLIHQYEISQMSTSSSPVIFLSHANCDKAIVRQIVDFLKGSMAIHDDMIRCTSISGHKLEYGQDIDDLREEIITCKAFLMFLSHDAQNRPNVIMELGAAWAAKRPLFVLLGKGVSFKATGFVSNKNHLSVDDADFATDVKVFVNQIARAIDCKLQSEPSRDRARDALAAAMASLPSTPTPTPAKAMSQSDKLKKQVEALVLSIDLKSAQPYASVQLLNTLNALIAQAKQIDPAITVSGLMNPQSGFGAQFGLTNVPLADIQSWARMLIAALD